jgi:murein DD-endopeptidase MepM/ murein hydrolase activator NlpD
VFRPARVPRRGALVLGVVAALALPGTARPAMGDPETAALQVALRERSLYAGDVDGIYGPATSAAVALLQRQAGLPVTGSSGPPARALLGGAGQPTLGSRLLTLGLVGWDVAELQFLLAWHGFPSGPLDGIFGLSTQAALLRFQEWVGLEADGIAGPAVLAALEAPPPTARVMLAWPLALPVGDRFGPRGGRFHAGVDIPAPAGTPVTAAAGGRVVYAGWREGGWGNEVTIASGDGLRQIYAHLAEVDVLLNATVRAGDPIGLVGATGDATGPHLHFELRLRGAAVDPLASLPPSPGLPAPPAPAATTSARDND